MEKKKICQIFRNNELKITIEANSKRVNYLDVTFDLETGLHKPYMKPNEEPVYVHRESNHPQGILENIPLSINKRLSAISSNEHVFNAASPPYQKALEDSGYNFKLKYDPQANEKSFKSKNRKRKNILWVNPPFSKSVKTPVGKKILELIDKHFPKTNPLSKIFNKNTVKVSYSCMPNIQQKINQHNFKVMKSTAETTVQDKCNCSGKMGPCPLDGKCLAQSIIYKAEISDQNSNLETYTGLTSQTFKKRFYKHRESFLKRNPDNSTTLSTHVWNLKDQGIDFNIKWSIIGRAKPFNPSTRKCRLCLKEIYNIIFRPEGASLNERSELFTPCRHRKQQLLQNS